MLSEFESGQTIGPHTGDFAYFDHRTKVAVATHAIELAAQHMSPEEIRRRRERAEQGIRQLHEHISDPLISARIERIAKRYALVSQGSASTQIKRRIATSSGIDIVSDLDGTVTYKPFNYQGSYTELLMENFPGSPLGESILEEKGRENFPLAHALAWQHGLTMSPDLYRQLGREIPIRDGVKSFFERMHDNGSKIVILSASFFPFAEEVVARATSADDVEIKAVTHNDITSTAKREQLLSLAAERPDRGLIFIGDGSSDLPAIEAHHALTGIFALKGGRFAEELETRHIPHLQYRDFNDIHVQLSQLSNTKKNRIIA